MRMNHGEWYSTYGNMGSSGLGSLNSLSYILTVTGVDLGFALSPEIPKSLSIQQRSKQGFMCPVDHRDLLRWPGSTSQSVA